MARRIDANHVEDVVADTFMVAWRKLDDLPRDELPWLFLTAHHQIGNRLRTARRGDIRKLEPQRVVEDPAITYQDRQLDERIAAAINHLSEVEREAFMLVAWDGLSTARAAKAAGCNPVALRVRFHRARRKLAQSITAQSGPRVTLQNVHELKEEAS